MSPGPLAILPLTGNRSSIVWSETTDQAAAIHALGDAEYLAVLRRAGELVEVSVPASCTGFICHALAGHPRTDPDRQVEQSQDPLVAILETCPVVRSHQLPSPVHLVGDHQDLPVTAVPGPLLFCQSRVLRQVSGSPSPISAYASAATRERSSASSISIERLSWAGRMLMSAVNSRHSSWPRPG